MEEGWAVERGHGGEALIRDKKARFGTTGPVTRTAKGRATSDCEPFTSERTDHSQGNAGDAGTTMAACGVMVMMSRTRFWDIEVRRAQYGALCPFCIVDRDEGRVPERPGVACESSR